MWLVHSTVLMLLGVGAIRFSQDLKNSWQEHQACFLCFLGCEINCQDGDTEIKP
jgi:hypothetical protein